MAICGYRLSHQVGRICVIRLLDRADANDDPFFFSTRRIGVEEGWRALYKGLGPSLVGIIPARYVTSLKAHSVCRKQLTRPS